MTYSAPTIAALQSGALVLRDLLSIDNGTDVFGFWVGEDNVTTNVIGGLTGTNSSRSYVGGALGKVPTIAHTIGLESQSIALELSQIHSVVKDTVYGELVRGARVELHRGIFNPATWALVDEPEVRFVGRLETADPKIAGAGAEGSITIGCSDDRVELTRMNPALKSDETMKALHPGDTFRQHDTAGLIDVRWGQAKGKVKR